MNLLSRSNFGNSRVTFGSHALLIVNTWCLHCLACVDNYNRNQNGTLCHIWRELYIDNHHIRPFHELSTLCRDSGKQGLSIDETRLLNAQNSSTAQVASFESRTWICKVWYNSVLFLWRRDNSNEISPFARIFRVKTHYLHIQERSMLYLYMPASS